MVDTSLLATAEQTILTPADIQQSDINRLIAELCATQVDAADIYFQNTRHESWSLEDGIVKEGSFNIEQGAGVRAISGEKTGFAYTDELNLNALLEAAHSARAIARSGQNQVHKVSSEMTPESLYNSSDPIQSLETDRKIELLKRIDRETRALDPRIEQVMVSLSGVHESVVIATHEGMICGDIRPLVRLNVSVIIEQNGRRESGGFGGGGRTDYRYFLDQDRAMDYAREALRQADIAMQAEPAPAGSMTVVLGSGWPGILLHEAIGHGLEGDFNRKGTSAFSGRLGETVASPLCTIVDDGTLKDRRGSLNIDDEGTPTECTVLIENGQLKDYMQDTMNARLMGMRPTGNGRRESYSHRPMPRMTNTYMLPGESAPEEIINSVKSGIYAQNFGGGQVDITSGKFVFTANEAYLIENGKITCPVKGATLIGNGPDVLTRVSMVGNDMQLDSGVGTCGKEGQSVPVGVGQPTLKIDALTVGGTQV
ncbi:MAG: metalloprotease TldD [Gammaproteobacteria bacterium]|nr:metalloprotease TldD [Gammaproteobacteria bacterium]